MILLAMRESLLRFFLYPMIPPTASHRVMFIMHHGNKDCMAVLTYCRKTCCKVLLYLKHTWVLK